MIKLGLTNAAEGKRLRNSFLVSREKYERIRELFASNDIGYCEISERY